jgi:hypothetical protein
MANFGRPSREVVLDMISYAQNFEDVLLNPVFKDRTSGFYIDVGAMDPVVTSVTKTFYDRSWHGVNIEPGPAYHQSLIRERRRDVNLDVAVDEREEVKTLFTSSKMREFQHLITSETILCTGASTTKRFHAR